jgi:hypothetical protein
LSHGVINPTAESISDAKRLRVQAKNIVRVLYAIAARHGHDIPQPIDYYKAIGLTAPTSPPNIRLQSTASGMVIRRG